LARTNQKQIGLPIAQTLAKRFPGPDGNGPLHTRLARALRASIEAGELLPGTRLPPERTLAAEFAIARSTVARAYDTLRLDQLVDRRQGRGTTVVGERAHISGRAAALAGSTQRNMIFHSLTDPGDETIEFISAHAPASDVVSDALTTATRALKLGDHARHHGYFPLGYGPLRQALAARLTERGLPTHESDLMITTGAQQAITLIASCCVSPNEAVVLEDPTFPGAIDALRACGARLLTAPVQETSADVKSLKRTIDRNDVRVVYLVPTFHNPTGCLMSLDARREIGNLIDAASLTVIEDESLADLGFEQEPPLPIAAFAAVGTVITIGSLSKLVWGGLRLGWIRAAPAMIAHLGRVKALADLGTSIVPQAIAVELLSNVELIRAARRRELLERLTLVTDLLERLLPDWQWTRPAGGVSLWVRLPGGSSRELARVAADYGVTIVPGSVMSPRESGDEFLRLPFSNSIEMLEEGVRRLAKAWTAYSDEEPSERALEIIV
jgi:DNA-binding transcriptional MocR family regulator